LQVKNSSNLKTIKKMKSIKKAALLTLIFVTLSFIKPDEGMYPVSSLNRINLKEAGINLTPNQIFNENGGAVSDALVRLGGCTGSFVSAEGMIITNHHCVFGSVSRLSTPTNNYLQDGFHAAQMENELATGLPAKITINSKDVSTEILKDLDNKVGLARDIQMKTNSNKILSTAQSKDSLHTFEISEMFEGKQYVLFTYLTLLDVRLVYVPPRYIGEFGAETDNWEWPRHTGDFSIVRAYIGKDGKPAAYNAENVPFEPKRHLKINPNGTQENDAVFILGYPGRTYRHQPYQFLQYQNDYLMPQVVDWFTWRIEKMEELSKNNTAKYLGFASTIKGLANTQKNFRGKIQGLRRTSVLADKAKEDELMGNFAIASYKSETYKNVLSEIETIYTERNKHADFDFYIQRLFNDVPAMGAAMEAYVQMISENPNRDFSSFVQYYSKVDDHELNIASIEYLFDKLNTIHGKNHYGEILIPLMEKDKFVKMYNKSVFSDYANKLKPLINKKSKKVFNKKDGLIKIVERLYPYYFAAQARGSAFKAKNDVLMPLYTDLKMDYKKTDFLPDANSTLRFTYGRVKGFSPNDGTYNYPHTTLNGIIEKANSMADYVMPLDALAIYKNTIAAPMLVDKKTGKVIVGLLYDLDTTGGNSGSPVMDANGNLVGINFDRAYTATINDYAWNEAYSRSIAVDIRYVIYVLKYIGKADNVLEELQIKI